MIPPAALPAWDPHRALFLDVDGTLLDIRDHPDEVRATPSLLQLLEGAQQSLDGALALVSGRSIASLDEVFGELRLPAAGLHGLERRDARGRLHRPRGYAARIAVARDELLAFAQSATGVLLEDKGAALALHYRNAPALAEQCRQCMEHARSLAGEDFHVQHGKMVLELKPSGHDKGTAIRAFMEEAPFRGRPPMFVGDDLTDEDGFKVVNASQGISVRVGAAAQTAAAIGVAGVPEVLDWLRLSLEKNNARQA